MAQIEFLPNNKVPYNDFQYQTEINPDEFDANFTSISQKLTQLIISNNAIDIDVDALQTRIEQLSASIIGQIPEYSLETTKLTINAYNDLKNANYLGGVSSTEVLSRISASLNSNFTQLTQKTSISDNDVFVIQDTLSVLTPKENKKITFDTIKDAITDTSISNQGDSNDISGFGVAYAESTVISPTHNSVIKVSGSVSSIEDKNSYYITSLTTLDTAKNYNVWSYVIVNGTYIYSPTYQLVVTSPQAPSEADATLQAKAFDDTVSAINTVTLGDETAILNAFTTYNSLHVTVQIKTTKLETLQTYAQQLMFLKRIQGQTTFPIVPVYQKNVLKFSASYFNKDNSYDYISNVRITEYYDDFKMLFIPKTTNIGAAYINVNNLGYKQIYMKIGGLYVACGKNSLTTNVPVILTYKSPFEGTSVSGFYITPLTVSLIGSNLASDYIRYSPRRNLNGELMYYTHTNDVTEKIFLSTNAVGNQNILHDFSPYTFTVDHRKRYFKINFKLLTYMSRISGGYVTIGTHKLIVKVNGTQLYEDTTLSNTNTYVNKTYYGELQVNEGSDINVVFEYVLNTTNGGIYTYTAKIKDMVIQLEDLI